MLKPNWCIFFVPVTLIELVTLSIIINYYMVTHILFTQSSRERVPTEISMHILH